MRRALRQIPLLSDIFRVVRDSLVRFQKPRLSKDGFMFIGNDQIISGEYEPEVKSFLYQVIGKFSTFVNIGANHGYYLCLATKLGFKNVIGVEPLIQNVRVLRRNLAINNFGSAKIVRSACGSPKDSSVVLFGSGTGASTQKGWGGAKSKIKRTVSIIALDSLVGIDDGPCVFVIDVEGYENKVLEGAGNLLKRKSDVWFVEISFYENSPDGSMNPDALKIFRLFAESGFEAYAWIPTLRKIVVNDARDLDQFANIFHMFLFARRNSDRDNFLEFLESEIQ